MTTTLLSFYNTLDYRARTPTKATVARLFHDGVLDYVVIGTQYGHLHTTSGNIRTWKSYSGARRVAKEYSPM